MGAVNQKNILPPPWLPELASVNGQWELVLKALYGIFERDFVRGGCYFQGFAVRWDRRKLGGDRYEEGFWHLITKMDKLSGERLFDPRRAERLPWCKPTLTHSADPEVKAWDYRESDGVVSTYVWLENWDYVVILRKRQQDRGVVAFLVTAYHVDYNSTRRNLRAKLAKREEP